MKKINRRSFLAAAGPVSYTHLDVYKRQGYNSACSEMTTGHF